MRLFVYINFISFYFRGTYLFGIYSQRAKFNDHQQYFLLHYYVKINDVVF